MKRSGFLALAVLALASATSSAQVLTLFDGPSPSVFANGGGTGFGGTLGAGSISMDVVGTDVVINFVPGAALNDIAAIYLDTRAGGFTDAQMDDQADGGRRVVSNLTRDFLDFFPTQPDFGLAIGNFGSVLFELNAGNTPGHLNFLQFNAAQSITIPLASLGNPTQIDFFAAYSSDSNFNSNESLPAFAGLNGAGSPGFGTADVTYGTFNRFVVVPEPTSMSLLGMVGLGVVARRFRRK